MRRHINVQKHISAFFYYFDEQCRNYNALNEAMKYKNSIWAGNALL
jgi:hypothetical protein